MGKRPVVVISSSSEGEYVGSSERRGLRSSKSKTRKSASDRKPKAAKSAKKARFSASHKGSSGIEEVDLDMLSEELQGFNVMPGRQLDGSTELWVDKYKPTTVTELAVHRKKIEEVKSWLEQRVGLDKNKLQGSTLLILGPSGVGKSMTIHVLAVVLDFEVCEWNTPTPTLWQEHLHNSNSGISYNSKLDEFISFVESMRKYPSLSSLLKENRKRPCVLLIEDLPFASNAIAFKKLSKCLQLLVQWSQVPTVVLFTELRRNDLLYNNARDQEGLISDLERAGACKISFNPVTDSNIKKVLSKICKGEFLEAKAEFLDGIVKTCQGDIRHAITTLQYLCSKSDNICVPPQSARRISRHMREKKEAGLECAFDIEENSDAKFLLPFGKDESLSLFHALGKFLHNKREDSESSILGKSPFILHERYLRSPLKMETPEKVLSKAHAQPGSLIDFLYENVLDFISDDAVDDACTVSFYLSECDQLRATSSTYGTLRSQPRAEINEPDSIPQQVAALVAARGVLYGNLHPSPSRWHSIRTPKLWQTEFSFLQKKNQIVADKFVADSNFSSTSFTVMATEVRPALKWLQYRSPGVGSHRKQSQCQMESGAANLMVDSQFTNNVESDSDEIEDC